MNRNDYHGRIFWLFGNNDWKVTHAACALSRPGDVFLDIGANHGTVGFAVGRIVGPEGHIHMFELQAYLARRLRGVVEQNALGNVTVHEAALLDRDGETTMSMPRCYSSMASIMAEMQSDSRFTERVTVRTADTRPYVESLTADRPFGIKIDIEGTEPLVLERLIDHRACASSCSKATRTSAPCSTC